MPETEEKLTALLAHGKNWEMPIPDEPSDLRPSFDTRLTAEAAGILFTGGVYGLSFDRLILSTGHTLGDDYPSEAEAMLKVMRERFDDTVIPKDVILMEEESFDTASNMRFVSERCREHNIGSIALLTVGYHLPRTRRLAYRLLDDSITISGAYKSNVVVRLDRDESGFFYLRSIINEARKRKNEKPKPQLIRRLVSSLALEAGATVLAPIDPTGEGISSRITSRLRRQDGVAESG